MGRRREEKSARKEDGADQSKHLGPAQLNVEATRAEGNDDEDDDGGEGKRKAASLWERREGQGGKQDDEHVLCSNE